MSHLDSIAVRITDLPALRRVAEKQFGAIWEQDKKKFNWYGAYVGDTKMPENLKGIEPGTCEHVIRLPGVRYEVGVVKLKDGSYTLAHDYYSHASAGHDGHRLVEKFGPGLKKLAAAYSTEKMVSWVKSKGFLVNQKPLANNRTEISITGIV